MKPVFRKYGKQSGFNDGLIIVFVFLAISIVAGGSLIVSHTMRSISPTFQSSPVSPPQPPGQKEDSGQMGYFIPIVTPTSPPATFSDACPSLDVTITTSSINYYCDGESGLIGDPNTLYACKLPEKQSITQPILCANGCLANDSYDSECNGPGPTGNNINCGNCMQSGFHYLCAKPGSVNICTNFDDALNSYYPQGYTCNRCN